MIERNRTKAALFLAAIQLPFVILRILGVIKGSWFLVLLPVEIIFVFILFLAVLLFVVEFVHEVQSRLKEIEEEKKSGR